MGNRANVVIKSNEGTDQVCLYTHWGRDELPAVLRAALVRGKSRWTDAQYLSRIIFCEMTRGEQWEDTTGFGISQQLGDGADSVLTVDIDLQAVSINDDVSFDFTTFCNSAASW